MLEVRLLIEPGVYSETEDENEAPQPDGRRIRQSFPPGTTHAYVKLDDGWHYKSFANAWNDKHSQRDADHQVRRSLVNTAEEIYGASPPATWPKKDPPK